MTTKEEEGPMVALKEFIRRIETTNEDCSFLISYHLNYSTTRALYCRENGIYFYVLHGSCDMIEQYTKNVFIECLFHYIDTNETWPLL